MPVSNAEKEFVLYVTEQMQLLGPVYVKATSINCLFVRLLRWMYFSILMYPIYTAGLTIHPPCTRTKIRINRRTLKSMFGGHGLFLELCDMMYDHRMNIDGRKLSREALADIRIKAVQRVEEGERSE